MAKREKRDTVLYKIAYLGEGFCGSARQPHARTVEGEVRRVLREEGFSDDIRMACRTDRGVSALCNIFSTSDSTDYCSRLTSRLERIWVYASCPSASDLRACMKHYVYIYRGKTDVVREACSLFSGTHDFSLFSKPEKRNPSRTLVIEVEERGDVLLLHFFSRGFLWEMVRRIVGAVDMACSGTLTRDEIETMLRGEGRRAIQPASPEFLLLADIETGLAFDECRYVRARMEKDLLGRSTHHALSARLYEEMRVFLAS